MVRRILIGAALLAGVVLVAGGVIWARADTSNVGELGFERELRIPPLLEPDEDGVVELEMREGTSELLAGKRTATWGFNGSYLGPTIRAARGEELHVRVTNALPEASTVHWHGMHLPAKADGGPHQPIEPGGTWTPSWTVDQPAATLWYHPHPHETTEEHVYRGLAGMFIVEEPGGPDLPDDYGVDDIPLIVQDKRFEEDGALSFSQRPISPTGRLGDEILVNGTSDPHLDVTTTRVRLRLLNASSARIYDFGFADGRPLHLIATDGGLLRAPARLDRVQLSPGERAEVVVAFEPGERAVLRSFEPDLEGVDPLNARFSGADDTFDILELRAGEELAASPPLPETLAPRPAPDPAAAGRVRRFELGSRDINDRRMDMHRIDAAVPPGATEVWEVHNRAGIPHNLHVHGVTFDVLDPGEPALSGPKDTVPVMPGETVRLLVRFAGYADPSAPYMLHCHLLQHEDRGMMAQFVVAYRKASWSSHSDLTSTHQSTAMRSRTYSYGR